MIYIIDHNDSFTYNVVHQFSKFDEVICDNYDRVNNDILEKASSIVLSPGPGNPKNIQNLQKFIKNIREKKE
jgi:anthranilate/para-aminobenzoate synthase component II